MMAEGGDGGEVAARGGNALFLSLSISLYIF